MIKIQITETNINNIVFDLEHSNFGFVWDFDIRISDLSQT